MAALTMWGRTALPAGAPVPFVAWLGRPDAATFAEWLPAAPLCGLVLASVLVFLPLTETRRNDEPAVPPQDTLLICLAALGVLAALQAAVVLDAARTTPSLGYLTIGGGFGLAHVVIGRFLEMAYP